MAVTSTRISVITFSGDLQGSFSFPAANNAQAPGDIDLLALTTGANVITLPTGGSTPKAATIVPPPGNTVALTVKGTSADTGVVMHLTDPLTLTFSTSPPASFVLNSAGVLNGLRVIWS